MKKLDILKYVAIIILVIGIFISIGFAIYYIKQSQETVQPQEIEQSSEIEQPPKVKLPSKVKQPPKIEQPLLSKTVQSIIQNPVNTLSVIKTEIENTKQIILNNVLSEQQETTKPTIIELEKQI